MADRNVLRQKIALTDSIIALYDVTRPETFDSLREVWLPLIEEVSRQIRTSTSQLASSQENRNNQIKPVIIVGNKNDLHAEAQNFEEKLESLITAFPFVILCSECSALKLEDVDDTFYFAEMVFTFPPRPIYDVINGDFTPKCR